jgi:phosphoenolpyruvate mutase
MKKKLIYIGIASDVLNNGHINILKKAKKMGNVMVGLFSDQAISNFKNLPLLTYEKRFNLISSIKYVNYIVKQDDENYLTNLKKYKPDILIHGNIWRQNNNKSIKKNIIKTLKKWNGKLIEIKYSNSADKDKKFLDKLSEISNNPEYRVSRLKRMLKAKKIIRLLECSNALSGYIIENLKIKTKNQENSFDGMWSSSLSDSALRGKPDNQSVDFSTRLNGINEIFENTSKPLLFDADNGGRLEHLKFLTNSLERLGVSGVVMEDKKGLKINSLFNSKKQAKSKQDSITNFCKKIKVIKNYRKNNDFLIFARIESLILDKGMGDAIKRAINYHKAGADVILIHSKKKTPNEIFEFSRRLKKKIPNSCLAAIPSTYSKTREEELIKNNFKIVIYANQLLRSIYPAMTKTAKEILQNGRSFESEKNLENIDNIINLFEN